MGLLHFSNIKLVGSFNLIILFIELTISKIFLSSKSSLLIKLFGNTGVAYAVIIMTALIVIFAEILPKNKPIGAIGAKKSANSRKLHLIL